MSNNTTANLDDFLCAEQCEEVYTEPMTTQEDFLTCEDCGIKSKDVATEFCPHAHEIHNEDVKITVCRECCYQRAMDI